MLAESVGRKCWQKVLYSTLGLGLIVTGMSSAITDLHGDPKDVQCTS